MSELSKFVYAREDITQCPNEFSLGFIYAEKNQKLLVLDNDSSFWDYLVQDIDKEFPPFYGNEEDFKMNERDS
jgi:hypothetical protein